MTFSRKQNPNKRNAGFTLLEMLIVLVILSALLSTAYFRYTPAQSKVSNFEFGNNLRAELGKGRSFAQLKGKPIEAIFDLENRMISILSQQLTIPENIYLTIFTGRENVRSSRKAILRFLPDGSSIGAKIEIQQSGNPNVELNVHWLTGAITARSVQG